MLRFSQVFFFPLQIFPLKTCTQLPSFPHLPCYPNISFFIIWLHLTTFDKEYTPWRSSLSCLPHSPLTATLLGQNMVLKTLFKNILSLYSSRNVRNQISLVYLSSSSITLFVTSFNFVWYFLRFRFVVCYSMYVFCCMFLCVLSLLLWQTNNK